MKHQASLQTVPSVAVMGAVSVAAVAPTARLLLTQRSSKLIDILKVLLCYSNNFMADRIGEALGGPESVRQRLIADLQLAPDDLRIAAEHEGGHTPLMRAALGGETEIVKRLLSGGADVNEKDDEGRTALMFAVTNLHGQCAKALLGQGADPNARANDFHSIDAGSIVW